MTRLACMTNASSPPNSTAGCARGTAADESDLAAPLSTVSLHALSSFERGRIGRGGNDEVHADPLRGRVHRVQPAERLPDPGYGGGPRAGGLAQRPHGPGCAAARRSAHA